MVSEQIIRDAMGNIHKKMQSLQTSWRRPLWVIFSVPIKTVLNSLSGASFISFLWTILFELCSQSRCQSRKIILYQSFIGRFSRRRRRGCLLLRSTLPLRRPSRTTNSVTSTSSWGCARWTNAPFSNGSSTTIAARTNSRKKCERRKVGA